MLAWFTGSAIKNTSVFVGYFMLHLFVISHEWNINAPQSSAEMKRQTRMTDVSMATRVIFQTITKKRDRGSSVLIFPSPTWWYSDRMLCISSTSSLEISFPTNVRSYDVSSSPTHAPSSFLMGGLRARETCWWENDKGTSSCRNTPTQRLLISF